MSEKKHAPLLDADGFQILKRKPSPEDEQRDSEGFLVLTRKESPKAKKTSPATPPHTNKHNEKKGKKEKSKPAKLLHWLYDNETTIGCTIKTGKHFSEPKLLENEADRNSYTSLLEKQDVKPAKPSELPVGVDCFSKEYLEYYHRQGVEISDFDAFRSMTQDGQEDKMRLPFLKLACGILSSYIIRSVWECHDIDRTFGLDEKNIRAFHIVVSYSENGYHCLNQVCESMIVNTTVDDDTWAKIKALTIIPPNSERDIRDIKEMAYLQIRGYKDYKWPAPYRDTSVLFDCRAVKDKAICDFIDLNPWCTCVLYGKKNFPNKAFGLCEKINGTYIASGSLEWDVQSVYRLIEAFVAHVPSFFDGVKPKFVDIWLKSGQYFENYVKAQNNKPSEADRFKLRMEVSALLTFIRFVQEESVIPDEVIDEFRDSALNILWPGCIPREDPVVASAPPVPAKSPKEILEEFLQTIITLESLNHFYPILNKNGALHPDVAEDGSELWGYIKYFKWQDGDDGKVPCLIFFEEVLKRLNREQGTPIPNFDDTVKKIKDSSTYIHSSKNYNFRPTTDSEYQQPRALRLKISDLPISEDVKGSLLAKAERCLINKSNTKEETIQQ